MATFISRKNKSGVPRISLGFVSKFPTTWLQTFANAISFFERYILFLNKLKKAAQYPNVQADVNRYHFKKDIKVKGEIGVMLPGLTDGGGWMSMDLDDIIRGEPEYSLWQTRDRRWFDCAGT